MANKIYNDVLQNDFVCSFVFNRTPPLQRSKAVYIVGLPPRRAEGYVCIYIFVFSLILRGLTSPLLTILKSGNSFELTNNPAN